MKRWICWPTFDAVCVQGGCSYCNPFNCACGKRHTGSRKVTELTVRLKAREQGLSVSWKDIDDGMARQPVREDVKA